MVLLSNAVRFKVGIFTLAALILMVVTTVLVNDKPYWWRPCQYIKISVSDATGIKPNSAVRSLGIEIGYIKSVKLTDTEVNLGLCITAPIEILPNTRAHIRGEGFLGDKFIELKPVKYLSPTPSKPDSQDQGQDSQWIDLDRSQEVSFLHFLGFTSLAYAADSPPQPPPQLSSQPSPRPRKSGKGGREVPVAGESQDVQQLVNQVGDVVHQMSQLTDNLKQSINPEELRRTMRQLTQTLENASKTLAPEGGLNQTAQRTLAKLEDSIEQLRAIMTRVNKGEGSLGKLLNDPVYAEEIHKAIQNVNRLLNRVGDVRFQVDIGGAQISGYDGGRGWFQLGIWPSKARYYLLGIAMDPRGRISNTTVTTTAGGLTQTTQTRIVDQTSVLFTAMMGKVFFDRLDLSIGALYGDGAASVSLWLGPRGYEDRIQLRNDVYARNAAASVDDRITLSFMPLQNIYIRGGFESLRGYPGTGKAVYFYGAGITFDDEDIKLLFAFK